VTLEPRAELGGCRARGEHHVGRVRQGPQPPRHPNPASADGLTSTTTTSGRSAVTPAIAGGHVGDHIYSFGAQQRAAAWIVKEKLRDALNLRARVTGSTPCERNVRDRLFPSIPGAPGMTTSPS